MNKRLITIFFLISLFSLSIVSAVSSNLPFQDDFESGMDGWGTENNSGYLLCSLSDCTSEGYNSIGVSSNPPRASAVDRSCPGNFSSCINGENEFIYYLRGSAGSTILLRPNSTGNPSFYHNFSTLGWKNIKISYFLRTKFNFFNDLESNDRILVEYRIGNSGPWSSIENLKDPSVYWEKHSFSLTSGLNNKPLIQIRFLLFIPDDQGSLDHFFIDDFNIIGDPISICGNGVKESGEQCDEGNNNGQPNKCNLQCSGITPSICGNLVTEIGEECDHGPFGDLVCTSGCKFTKCGDGILQPGFEQCDDGNKINGDGCDNGCNIEPPLCGNGVKESGEFCDDGNQLSGDGCSSSCKIESCGDGVLDDGEECELGNQNGIACIPVYGRSCFWCSTTCELQETPGLFCGDQIVNGPEQCDDGNLNNNDLCRNDCRIPICGDGYLNPEEQCDDSNLIDGDGCSNTCKEEPEIPDNCFLYDDFSSGILDTNKWEEKTFHGDPFTDEHFVSSSDESYIIRQDNIGDAQTNLKPKINFTNGNSFSYELIYNSGSGNHASQPLVNGNYPPTQVEPCLASGGCGIVGFWNGIPDLESQIGKYKIKFEFFTNQVKMTTIRPDNTIVVNTFTGNSEPYELEINTHTGHNGLINVDYDNFIKCHNPTCGDRILDTNEECDGGSLGEPVCTPSYGSSCNYCDSSCNGQTVQGSYCGDGTIDIQEECDDGNNQNNDGCSSICKIECPSDKDNDDVCDNIDRCLNSKAGEPVDDFGCDIFQFCSHSGFSCGASCSTADWRNNEPNVKYPNDCTVIIPHSGGIPQQPKCVPTEFSPMCAG